MASFVGACSESLVSVIWNEPQYLISLNKEVWNAALNSASTSSKVGVVSFLGKTQAGKSTLIRGIQNRYLPEEKVSISSPNVVKGLSRAPTSSGVRTFRIPLDDESVILLADYEGECAGKLPRDDGVSGSIDIAQLEERRNITKSDLRRLSYVSSNVIVFVSKCSFSDSSELDRIMEFAIEASNAISDANQPSLLIVQNRVDLGDEDDPISEEDAAKLYPLVATEDYFDSFDQEKTLLNLFHDVSVVILPDAKKPAYLEENGQVRCISGKELYDRQLDILNSEIRRLLAAQEEYLRARGDVMTEYTWITLMKLLLENFYHKRDGGDNTQRLVMQPIQMPHMLLRLMLGDETTENNLMRSANIAFAASRYRQKLSLDIFTELNPDFADYRYQKQSCTRCNTTDIEPDRLNFMIHKANDFPITFIGNVASHPADVLRRQFQQTLLISLQKIIFATVAQAIDVQELSSSDPEILIKKKTRVSAHVSVILRRAIDMWARQEPCTSEFSGPIDGDGEFLLFSSIPCEQSLHNHGKSHGNDSRCICHAEGVLSRLRKGVRKYLFWAVKSEQIAHSSCSQKDAVWKCDDDHPLPLPRITYELLEDDLMATLEIALRPIVEGDRRALIIMRAYQICLTTELFRFGQYPFFPFDSDRHCLVCLSSPAHVRCLVLRCGHSLCHDCYELIANRAIADSMSRITMHSVTFNDVDNCPFCHSTCVVDTAISS
jgi:GTPase SAR1 family protein